MSWGDITQEPMEAAVLTSWDCTILGRFEIVHSGKMDKLSDLG